MVQIQMCNIQQQQIKMSKEMDEFPNLGMSIGEYYKMLMEGKRPTRQRTVKEEVKLPTPLAPPPRTPTPMSMSHSNPATTLPIPPRRENPLARSQSEANRSSSGGGSKRKLKSKSKQLSRREGEAPLRGTLSTHPAQRLPFHQTGGSKPVLQQFNSTQESARSKLRSRPESKSHHHSVDKKKKKKKERIAPSDDEGEGLDPEVRNQRREEARKALQMSQKFEMVEVHPLHGQERYVCVESGENTFMIKKILKIQQRLEDPLKFDVQLDPAGEEQKASEQLIDFDETLFASRVFIAKLSHIEEAPESIRALFKTTENADDCSLLVTQLVQTSEEASQLPKFAALIPSDKEVILQRVNITDLQAILKGLYDLDDDEAGESYAQFLADNSGNYKVNLETILETAKALNQAFTKYENASSKIPITVENIEDYLFTLVNYTTADNDNSENRQKGFKQGVYLRAKYDNQHYNEHILFIKKLGGGSNSSSGDKSHKETRSEWLQINKFKVLADVSRGYISTECLSSANSDGSNRLKKRNIKYIGYRESLRQRMELRKIANETYDCEGGEIPRRAPVTKDSTGSPGDRCAVCFYQAHGYDHLRCSHCDKVFHEQCCLEPNTLHQLYLGVREEEWHCQECIRCVNCLGMGGKSQAQQLLVCRCCNSAYHVECMDPNAKLALPNHLLDGSVQLSEADFHCERCVQCEQCGSREAGKRQNKWSKDFKLCSSCNKRRKEKHYCLICDSLWPEDILKNIQYPPQTEEGREEARNQFFSYMRDNMIQCGHCKMSVHFRCDRMFQDEEILKKFKALQQGLFDDQSFLEVKYHCPDCRQQSRQSLILQIIDTLSAEDKNYYFQDPVEDQIPTYTKIIKTPMCFQYLREKARTKYYLSDAQSLMRDVSLIFENAMKFNLPKHKVHKEAQRLGAICTAIIDSVQNRLIANEKRTNDEERYKDWLRRERKRALKRELESRGGKMIRVGEDIMMIEEAGRGEETKQPVYHLIIEDLFDLLEHPLNDSTLANSNLLSTNQLALKESRVDDSENLEDDEDNDDQGGNDSKKPENSKKRQRSTANKGEKTAEEQALNKFSTSSKRARFNQTQQQSYSALSAASLLTQAMHHHQDQMQHTSDGHQSGTLSSAQNAQPLNLVQQQQQLMMNYYQEIDDERCYYSNPARCSFDDPCLAFEEMCYLCGSFGKREDFLSCTLCGESFHTYCLQLLPSDADDSSFDELQTYDQQELIKRFQGYWKCLNCKFCEICSSATQEAFLLYCDVCDKAFHSFCLTPQLNSIPKCQWKCQECFKCTKCDATSFFDPALHLKPGMQNQLLDSVASTLGEFEFSQNFSLCYECGQNEHKKSFCKICQQSNGVGDEKGKERQKRKRHSLNSLQNRNAEGGILETPQDDRMLKCKTCGYYCHIRCSRLLPPAITDESEGEQLEGNDLLDVDFKCLECLLQGKSINHLIKETCESYENMHSIISRHRLLGYLVTEILGQYIPHPDKVQIFIKAFINQNIDFFNDDLVMKDWLNLLETGVAFQTINSNDETTATIKESETPILQEEVKKEEIIVDNEMKVESEIPQLNTDLTKVYNLQQEDNLEEASSSDNAYEKMYGHKEGFLPPKRNLYEALASDQGHHRFGLRDHLADPFSPETQAFITIPLEENLQKIDYAQLYVDLELKAVMKIKLRFFDWFESMLKRIVLKNEKRTIKKSPIEEDAIEAVVAQSHDLTSLMGGVQDPPSQVDTQNAAQNPMCIEEDIQVDNPQKRLQCIMCKLKGELTVTGRLIPFQVNQFVHVNCALWSTDVHEIAEGGYLVNFFQVWTTRAKFTRCWHCNEFGASIFCFSSRQRCMAAYHFPCAYRNRKVSFAPRGSKETFCDQCCKGHRGLPLGLPTEYQNTKRRFQIAKNMQPWNMTHHTTSQSLQQQSLQAPDIPPNNGNSTSAADIEKPLMIEKWRPYYFDMFNRVGNLTVLSLRKEINQIIEEHCTNSKVLEDIHDFASIRIYWKYNNQPAEEPMQIGDEAELQSPSLPQKAFYMYHNEALRQLARNDLETILPYVSARVRDKVTVGLYYLSQDLDAQKTIQNARQEIDPTFQPQKDFWVRLMQHFMRERPRFSLNNIIFSITEFTGKTKYPVSIWNRVQDVKNKTFFLRSGEQVLQAQGQSSSERDQARDGGQVNNGTGPVLTFGANPSIVLGKKGDSSLLPGAAGRSAAANSLDEVFRRMTKINQMGEHQNPMASIKRVNASKHMQYEQVLHNLGKKMFYRAPPSTIFEEPSPIATQGVNAGTQQLSRQKSSNNGQNASSSAQAKGVPKKIRQTDSSVGGVGGQPTTNDTAASKESDLPIAMKYRLSKTQPKRVEVGPSKIHRNGLFTHEDLGASDIVIEYVGERIRNKVADKREIVYEQKGIGDCYLFRLDKEYIIDATFNGNKARYLNHSCDANCSARIITVQAQKHIIICANRAIKSGEELTYNYNFDYEAEKIECFCGAVNCLGRLN